MVLAGDIGGTKTEVAVFDSHDPAAQRFAWRFLNREAESLVPCLKRFLAESGAPVRTVCLAVAGTVRDGCCKMPNLPWTIDAEALRVALGVERVVLINDLEATAHGMLALSSEQLEIVNPGTPDPTGNLALIAAGTGLGEAILFRHGEGYRVSASEGGHADLAPCDEEGMDLLRFLWAKFGHASCERVVSGPGLANLHEFYSLSGYPEEPPEVTARIAEASDRAAAVAAAALAAESPRCVHALDRFLVAYGAEAGNLALKALATGGLYIGGGIAPKLAPKFRQGSFMRAFCAKGRFGEILAAVPVRLILEPRTALLGAALYASQEVSP